MEERHGDWESPMEVGGSIPPSPIHPENKDQHLCWSSQRSPCVVEEHSYCSEAASVRSGGAMRRENVGTSNHKPGEIPGRRKPKGSSAMTIN